MVKRYDVEDCGSWGCDASMTEYDNGHYVDIDDYQSLEQQNKVLREALEKIKQKAGLEMDYGSKNDCVQFCYISSTEALKEMETQ